MENKIDLTTSYEICAAHQLKHPDWTDEKNRLIFGKCADLHGHQYRLQVTLTGEIPTNTGMLINGFDVDKIVGEIILAEADHKHLNNLPFFKDHLPTAEWIAVWAFDKLKNTFPSHCRLKRVRIFETPSLYAEVNSLPLEGGGSGRG